MTDTVNAVPVIDTSGSMTYYGYVDITKRDSKAFVSYSRAGDGLGVVSYDTDGRFTYPTSGSLAIVDANLTQAVAAANAIQALSFTGSCTNIGGGIQKARSWLDAATSPKAIVLLSDGYQNCGTPPLSVLPAYPIYSCAMGTHADTSLMQQIATGTGGAYYNAPYPSTMMFIYNQIRGQPSFVNTIQNKINQIQPTGYALVSAAMGSSESEGQFGVTWNDASLQYTSSPNPGNNEISVTLVQPDGSIYSSAPQIVGTGYAVFNIGSPATGTWYAQVIPGSGSPEVQATTGAFEFPHDPAASPNLALSVAQPAAAGEPMVVTAKMAEGDQPMKNLRLQASVSHPAISVANALERHQDELAAVEPDEGDLDAGMPEDRARLAALHRQKLPQVDILPRRSYPIFLDRQKDGTYQAQVADTHQAGSYAVTVSAIGHSPTTGNEFQRTEHAATVVD